MKKKTFDLNKSLQTYLDALMYIKNGDHDCRHPDACNLCYELEEMTKTLRELTTFIENGINLVNG